jgi:5-methyltetrahydrofolate--homocysteine methyltransferase
VINFEEMANAIINGEAEQLKELVKKAIDEKVSVNSIINYGLIAGMQVVGKRFKNDEIYIPEVLVSARAMKEGMELLKPLLVEGEVNKKNTIIIGTVKGDLHDLGKNMVGMLAEGAGYKVIDIGINTEPELFVTTLKETGAKVVAMSALLTTTMHAMKEVIELLKEEGLRNNVKVIIGGAPVTPDYAAMIGADGYAPDAASAVDLLDELLS